VAKDHAKWLIGVEVRRVMVRKRWTALFAAALFVGVVVPQFSQPAVEAASTTALGISTLPRGENSDRQVVQGLEAKLAHQFRVARVFKAWDAPFPNRFDSWLSDGGRQLIVSVKAERASGAKVPWADIAAAVPGTPLYGEIERWATVMKALAEPGYFVFHHEPEVKGHEVFGEAPQFIAAWRNVVSIFRATGATEVKFLWTMTDHSFRADAADPRRAALWYPGDLYVDAIGGDVYNWYTCRNPQGTWASLQSLIEAQRRFGLAHPDEELWLPELGSLEDPLDATRKATWLTEAQQLFKQPGWEQFRGVVYFHLEHNDRYPECDWWIDSSGESLTAFGAWVSDPFYGGDGVVPPPVLLRIDDPAQGLIPGLRLRNRNP
jgi:hypothetical protein